MTSAVHPTGVADRLTDTYVEQVAQFNGEHGRLVGILTVPVAIRPAVGAVIIPGGAQNRVGSHRMFVKMARELATAGVASLRFDIAGMGDSSGNLPDFQGADADIDAAINSLVTNVDTLQFVALVGHCDGASAAILHSVKHPMLRMVLGLNPWARSEQGYAQAMVKTYYSNRLLQAAFWKKLITGKVPVWRSLAQFAGSLKRSVSKRRPGNAAVGQTERPAALVDRLATAIRTTHLSYLFIVGSVDLAGEEFGQQMQQRQIAGLPQVDLQVIAHADHSFSDPQHWQQVTQTLSRALLGLAGPRHAESRDE